MPPVECRTGTNDVREGFAPIANGLKRIFAIPHVLALPFKSFSELSDALRSPVNFDLSAVCVLASGGQYHLNAAVFLVSKGLIKFRTIFEFRTVRDDEARVDLTFFNAPE